MQTLARLFGRSPFAVLQAHMKRVAKCVDQVPYLFKALQKNDQVLVDQIAAEISQLEHEADCTKNEIRNNLPSGLFLPIAKSALLEMLSIQDTIADRAEDIAVLLTLHPLQILPTFQNTLQEYLDKNLDTFYQANQIIQELTELLESSFGGIEAEKVKHLVASTSFKEHEADLLQRVLLKQFFSISNEIGSASFFLWMKVIHEIAAISDQSEKLAMRVRMTLEVK